MGLLDRMLGRPRGVGMTAAATLLEPDDTHELNRVRRGATDWQRKAWGYYDSLAEIRNAATIHSGSIGRLNLVPAVQLDPRTQPVPLSPEGSSVDGVTEVDEDTRGILEAAVERLALGATDGLHELARVIDLNLFIAGDGYLLGYEDDDGREVWDAASVEELVVNPSGSGYARRVTQEGSSSSVQSLPEDAWIIRTYRRHARFSGWSDSSMRSVLELCEELELLTHAITAAASSRLSAPVWFLPNGMRGGGPLDQTQSGQMDEASQDPVTRSLFEHFSTPKKNPRSAAGVVPAIVWADREDIAVIKDFLPLRDIDQEASAQRLEAIGRIATGLDLPTEALTGKANLNHWTAWQVDEESFKYHLEPGAQLLVSTLTTGYLRPMLEKMGVEDLERYFIWYDASDLVAHPNEEENYREGFDRDAVSFAALRKKLGIPEEDAPDEDELAQRLYARLVEKAPTTPIALPTPEQIMAGEFETAAPAAPPAFAAPPAPPAPEEAPEAPAGPPPAGPPAAETAKAAITLPPVRALTASSSVAPLGPRLASIERALRLRLMQASDDLLARALERAGSRLRNLANRRGATLKAAVAGLDPVDVAAALGPERVESLATNDDLLDGAFAPLEAKWDQWVRRAQEQGRAAVDEHAPDGLQDADELALAQERDRAEGWGVLEAGLVALAATRLFEPRPEPPARGELSDFAMAPGILNDALTQAGGGPSSTGLGGLLLGDTMMEAIDASKLGVTSYTWEHGDPVRDFEPHLNLALEGVTFETWDDAQLANDQEWPDVDYFSPNNGPDGPDHDGCTCYAVPVIEARGGD